MADKLLELMQTEGRLPQIPSARMNNFLTDFRADPANASRSRDKALAAWQVLKKMPSLKTYEHYRKAIKD